MNCSRCGASIPESAVSCPKCGFVFAEERQFLDGHGKSRDPGGVRGASGQPSDPFEFPMVIHEPTTSPSDEQPGKHQTDVTPPGGQPGSPPTGEHYVAPGDACSPGGFPGAQPTADIEYSTHAVTSGRSQRPLVVAGVLVLIAVIALAGAYFLVWNRDSEPTDPELTVLKFFDALSSGDLDLLKSVYTPEAVPNDDALSLISSLYSGGVIKYEDIKLETVNETATDAEVRVLDGTLTVTLAGEKVSTRLSDVMPDTNMSFKLKQIDGTWLISEGGQLPTNINIQTPSAVPPSGT